MKRVGRTLAAAAGAGAVMCILQTARGESPTAPAQPKDAVLASYNGGSITRGDFEQALAVQHPTVRAKFAADGKRSFLEELLRYDLLVQEAERRGYARDDLVRAAALGHAVDLMVARDLRVDPATVPASEVEAYYADNRADFVQPERRRATLIQLASKTEADKLKAELHGASRERVAEVARSRSIDQATRRMGGELGYFDREGRSNPGAERTVAEDLVAAAWKLERVGELGSPFPRDGGFALLMLTARDKGWEKPLATVEEKIRAVLAVEHEKRAVDALVEDLRKAAQVELHPELLDSIVLTPPAPLDIPAGVPAAPRDPRAPPKLVPPEDDGF